MFRTVCIVGVGLLVLLMQACTQIDNYLLGKDNVPEPSPLTALHASVAMHEQWTQSVGKNNSLDQGSYFKLKPVVSGNALYVANASGHVLALNKVTGEKLWSIQLPHGVISGPVVDANRLAFGGVNSNVLVLNKSDGQLLWQASVSGDVLGAPLLTADSVIVKTIDGHLTALDVTRGKKRWDIDHGSPSLILKASSSPVKAGHLVLVGFSDGKLDAVDAQTGRVVWQKSIAFAAGASDVERLVDIDADPLVDNDMLYIASYQGFLSALSVSQGENVWSRPASTYKNLAMNSNSLFMTDSDDSILSFTRANGQVRWKQLQLKSRVVTAPVLLDSWVLVGDKTGLVHILHANSGEIIGRATLKSSIDVEPVVSDHRVYVLTTSGQLSCYSIGKS